MLTDPVMDYWAGVFIARGLVRYMTFEAFMLSPHLVMHQIEHSDLLPLLARQRKVRDDTAPKADVTRIGDHRGRDRRRIKQPVVLRDQALVEPLKHRTWGH